MKWEVMECFYGTYVIHYNTQIHCKMEWFVLVIWSTLVAFIIYIYFNLNLRYQYLIIIIIIMYVFNSKEDLSLGQSILQKIWCFVILTLETCSLKHSTFCKKNCKIWFYFFFCIRAYIVHGSWLFLHYQVHTEVRILC